MRKTMSIYDFRDEMEDDFSYEACEIIFDALEDLDEDLEFDRVAIRCEYNESTTSEIFEDYAKHTWGEDFIQEYENAEQDEKDDMIEAFLENETWLLGTFEEDSERVFIYQAF